MAEEKLTKKQKKALAFKRGREEKPGEEAGEKVDAPAVDTAAEAEDPAPKKRKTRRAKKKTAPRFLLFVGNLPYDITEVELMLHFRAADPKAVRVRERGFAFLEFDPELTDIKRQMEVALRMHHSTLKQRKINVELTSGGGGNLDARREKLRAKNAKLGDERRERGEENAKASTKKPAGNVHPSRQGRVH